MNDFLWSQTFAACAFIVGITSFQFRNKNHVLLTWFFTVTLLGIHFIFLDKHEAGVLSLLNSFRFLSSIYTNKISIMLFFMMISIIGFAWTYQSPISFLALGATQLGTYASFRCPDQTFRILMMIVGMLWAIFDAIIGSPVAFLMEVSFILSNCIAYYRLYIKRNP